MRLDIRRITCRSALNRVKGMHFKWSLNPYRGCSHACTYCYARETHTYFDLNGGRDFERIIFAKVNVAERLREQLSAPRWPRELVAVGAATDPYQPVEGHLRLTQACLREFIRARTPVSLITKSTMVRRDRELLLEQARVAGLSLTISIPILDPHLARLIEPGAPAPQERLAAVADLSGLGLDVGVNMAPVLPGLTDSAASIDALVRASNDHGARYVGAGLLHLKPEPKRWFMARLRRRFPHLEPLYADLYPGQAVYAADSLQGAVQTKLANARARYPVQTERPAPIGPPPAPSQLAFGL